MPLSDATNKYQIMPLMNQEQYDELKEDIRANGVLEAITFDQNGEIVDGLHRFSAWGDLVEEGADVPMFPKTELSFNSDLDRVAYSISRNLKRRMMTREQRQELAVRLRLAPHNLSLATIAKLLNVSAKTIWYDLDEADEETKKQLEEIQLITSENGQIRAAHTMQIAPPVYTTGNEQIKQLNQQLLQVNLPEPVPTETKGEALAVKWGVKPGQIWYADSKTCPGMQHRILCGSARDGTTVKQMFNGGQASLLWTDPPYGVNYVGKTKDELVITNDSHLDLSTLLTDAFVIAAIHSESSAPFYICHPPGAISWTFGDVLRALKWRMHETLIWVKDSMVLGHSDYHLKHEPIYYGWMPDSDGFGGRPGRGSGSTSKWHGSDNQVSVFEVARPTRSDMHPTTKPTELITKQILNSSGYQQIVYDPFIGSGSTAIAAEQSARVCYGIDIDVNYVAITLERLSLLGLKVYLHA